MARETLIDILDWIEWNTSPKTAPGVCNDRPVSRPDRMMHAIAGGVVTFAANIARIADALATIATAQKLAHGPRRVPEEP
jgi:hypothetical protein